MHTLHALIKGEDRKHLIESAPVITGVFIFAFFAAAMLALVMLVTVVTV